MNKATYTLVGSLLVLSVFSRVGYADPAGKVGYVHDVNVEKGQSERLRTLIFPLMLKEHVKAVYEQAGNTVPTYVYHDELTSDGLKIKMLGKSAIVATYLITTGDLKSQGFAIEPVQGTVRINLELIDLNRLEAAQSSPKEAVVETNALWNAVMESFRSRMSEIALGTAVDESAALQELKAKYKSN